MILRRIPVVVALAGLAGAALLLDPRITPVAVQADAVTAAALSPLITPDDAGSSTWFCAGGSAMGNGPADQTVTVANPTDAQVAGVLQIFVEGKDVVRVPVAVGPHDQVQTALSSVAKGEWAAALVELDHGGVVVTHEVRGVGGWDSDRCSSRASTRWYFPWGQTSPQDGSSLRLALFNPFPAEAVVDITFDTDDGFRAPEALQGFLVPARRLVTVDVTGTVPVRQRISTTITARSGRLVVDRLQTLTGTDGTVTLDVTPGAPAPATSWYFADGRVDASTFERIAVYNPSEETAEVEVSVDRPRSTQELGIEPFELQIPPQSYGEVVLNDEGRIPKPLRHTTTVRSLNRVPVVAERVQLSGSVVAAAAVAEDEGGDAAAKSPASLSGSAASSSTPSLGTEVTLGPLPAGLSASLGTPVVATDWVVVMAARSDVKEAKVVITNAMPDQPVDLSITAWGKGRSITVELPASARRIGARQQIELPLAFAAGSGPLLVRVSGSGPIVVDGVQVFSPVPDTSFAPAVPMAVGVVVPGPLGDIAVPAVVRTTVPVTTTTTAVTTTSSTSTTRASTTTVVTTTTTTVAGGVTTTTVTVSRAAVPTTVAAVTVPATTAPQGSN